MTQTSSMMVPMVGKSLSPVELAAKVRLAAVGCEASMRDVLAGMVRLMTAMASKYARKNPGGPQPEDLLQIGLITVSKCVHLFDPGRGFRFSTYAGDAAAKEMCRAARGWKVHPQEPDADTNQTDASNHKLRLHRIEDPGPRPDSFWEEDEERRGGIDALAKVLRMLSPGDRKLLSLRYGLGSPTGDCMTWEAIARTRWIDGDTRQNVQQRVKRILVRLRLVLQDVRV